MPNLPASYDRLLDKAVERLTPEYIMAFTGTEEELERSSILLDRNNAGIITDEEMMELKAFAEADKFITMLKAKALLKLRSK